MQCTEYWFSEAEGGYDPCVFEAVSKSVVCELHGKLMDLAIRKGRKETKFVPQRPPTDPLERKHWRDDHYDLHGELIDIDDLAERAAEWTRI